MLADFIKSLPDAYPESRLALTRPAEDAATAAGRVDELVGHYADVYGCTEDLRCREEYAKYKLRLSEILGIDPERVDQTLEDSVRNGIVAASGAALLVMLLDSSAQAADTGGVLADIAAHGADVFDITDVLEIGATFGIGFILSKLAKWYFEAKNKEKLEKVQLLTETAWTQGLLARSVMSSGNDGIIRDSVERLRRLGVSANGMGVGG